MCVPTPFLLKGVQKVGDTITVSIVVLVVLAAYILDGRERGRGFMEVTLAVLIVAAFVAAMII